MRAQIVKHARRDQVPEVIARADASANPRRRDVRELKVPNLVATTLRQLD